MLHTTALQKPTMKRVCLRLNPGLSFLPNRFLSIVQYCITHFPKPKSFIFSVTTNAVVKSLSLHVCVCVCVHTTANANSRNSLRSKYSPYNPTMIAIYVAGKHCQSTDCSPPQLHWIGFINLRYYNPVKKAIHSRTACLHLFVFFLPCFMDRTRHCSRSWSLHWTVCAGVCAGTSGRLRSVPLVETRPVRSPVWQTRILCVLSWGQGQQKKEQGYCYSGRGM